MSTWLYDIAAVIKMLGGQTSLKQIYLAVRGRRKNLPTEWKASIRGTIYHHSSDSRIYVPGNPDVFLRVGCGEWALRHQSDRTIGAKSDFHLGGVPLLNLLDTMSKEELDGLISNGRLKETLEAKANELKHRYRIT